MFGTNFPISEYYRKNILDAETISRGGNWWTAVLLILDPKTKKPFVSFYRWQKTENGCLQGNDPGIKFTGKDQVNKVFHIPVDEGERYDRIPGS